MNKYNNSKRIDENFYLDMISFKITKINKLLKIVKLSKTG